MRGDSSIAWLSEVFEGRPLPELLAARDISAVFRFLSSRGWSRARIAAATGLAENRVRAVARGDQMITSYDVLTRIADGLSIDRGMMGLALVRQPGRTAAGLSARASNRPLTARGIITTAGWSVELGGARADLDDEVLINEVREVAQRYLQLDPVGVYAKASALADRSFVRIFEPVQPSRAGSEALGYLYAMLAWMSSDLGRRQASDAYARSAWLCATLAGSDTVRAWVLSSMSKTALWDGRPREAADLAQRGQGLVGRGTVRAMLACQEADARAAYGAADVALEALGRASTAMGSTTVDDIGGLLSCDAFRYLNYASAVRVKVGDPAGASRAAREALALVRSERLQPAYGTLAQTRISGALARIHDDDIDEAFALVMPVLETPRSQRLGPVVARMRNIEHAIAGRRVLRSSRTAVAMLDSVGDFCARPAGHDLPY